MEVFASWKSEKKQNNFYNKNKTVHQYRKGNRCENRVYKSVRQNAGCLNKAWQRELIAVVLRDGSGLMMHIVIVMVLYWRKETYIELSMLTGTESLPVSSDGNQSMPIPAVWQRGKKTMRLLRQLERNLPLQWVYPEAGRENFPVVGGDGRSLIAEIMVAENLAVIQAYGI